MTTILPDRRRVLYRPGDTYPCPRWKGPAVPSLLTDPRAAKACAHPLRVKIIARFSRLPSEAETPGAIAEGLGEPLGVISYHIRMLRDYEVVVLHHTEPRRGALQHFYVLTNLGDRIKRELVPAQEPPA